MSIEFEPDEINLAGFDNFVKAVNAKNPPFIKIGVLGAKVARPPANARTLGKRIVRAIKGQSDPTNAEIGAVHEYGSPTHGLPSRSFLRMPLTDVLPKTLEATNLFDEDQLKQVMETGNLVAWLIPIKALALGAVRGAFTNNGYGKWAAWKKGYTSKTGQILVDTGQLKDSIDAVVVQP